MALLFACGGEDGALLDIPAVGTEWVLIASAGGGRALSPKDIQIRRATDVTELEVPGVGNVNVELLFAGIRDEDLPKGTTVETLAFVSRVTEGTRPPPPLTAPHILNTPTPPGTAGRLVPVSSDELSDEVREDRRERFEKLLSELAIVDPCRELELAAPYRVPRTQGEAVFDVHVTASGTAVFALSATGTAIVGLLDPVRNDFEQVGIDAQIEEGERVAVWAFGPSEVTTFGDRVLPESMVLLRGGVIGRTLRFEGGRYRDDTPSCVDGEPCDFTHFVGRPGGITELELEGEPNVCVFGEVASTCTQGGAGSCEAGVWCRKKEGGPWREVAVIVKALRIVSFLPTETGPLALNIAGSVYAERTAGDWRELLRPNPDEDCLIGCVRLDKVTVPPSSSDVVAVVAGQKAQAWALVRRGSELAYERITSLDDALFRDERGGGERELEYLSARYAPDGALWLGTQSQRLFRVSPDRTEAERVCLPPGSEGILVSALGFDEDSRRLILGASPPAILVGTW